MLAHHFIFAPLFMSTFSLQRFILGVSSIWLYGCDSKPDRPTVIATQQEREKPGSLQALLDHDMDGLSAMFKSCKVEMSIEEDAEIADNHVKILRFGSNCQTKRSIFINGNMYSHDALSYKVLIQMAHQICDGSATFLTMFDKLCLTMVPLVNTCGIRRQLEHDHGSQKTCPWMDSLHHEQKGLDLNSNFHARWDEGSSDPETEDYHGASPMTHPVAKLFYGIVSFERPIAYINLIHLQETGFYRPLGEPDAKDQEKALDVVKSVICPGCPVSELQKPGSAADTFYQLGVKYSFELQQGALEDDSKNSKIEEMWSDALGKLFIHIHENADLQETSDLDHLGENHKLHAANEKFYVISEHHFKYGQDFPVYPPDPRD